MTETYIAGIRDYLAKLQDTIAKIDPAEIAAVAAVLRKAYDAQKTIFVMGNGGSGATASHMLCDLNKGACARTERKFRIISLSDNMPIILAVGNDIGFESVFVEQLKSYTQPGDVVIGISGSGNSPNVLRAIEYAKQLGCPTIGVCGFDGGRLKPLVDHSFHVRLNDMQIVEDLHMVLVHILMRILETGK
ncbi:MAG: SIS domain-containing protein [Thermoguttaceae bacterium]